MVPHALTVGEIAAIVQEYGVAAHFAKEAGFDGVQVHAGNGFLLDQFLRDGPTLLRMPSWLGVGLLEERELPLAPGDYKVTPGDSWTVTLLKTGETIYSGIGPVEVIRSPAPF
ncbi:hypothetical protein [Variovorax sp. MHTC-1]|uniref:oxidoreductase n=1 Tax=Variovorax sp. MHTC-1 TaxID=2495593 RepID=UPI0021AEACCA|nr:hypothetical protein [Variovorax sp. MHTC-1]